MNASLSNIEQGIKDAINALGRDYIAVVATYGGEFDDGLENVVRRFPAVWTTFEASGKPEQLSARKFKLPLVFITVVGARNLRNEEATRHGTEINGQTVEVGTFQLLQDVQSALLNRDLKDFGVDGIAPLTPGKISTIFNTKTRSDAISVLSQEWHTHLIIHAPDREADSAEWLERININYLFKPGDDVVDASDQVELNQ